MRSTLAILGVAFFVSTSLAQDKPPQGRLRVDPPPIATDKSIKYDYDIVYVRAPRFTKGADGSYKYFNDYTAQLNGDVDYIRDLWFDYYKGINTANTVIAASPRPVTVAWPSSSIEATPTSVLVYFAQCVTSRLRPSL